MGNSANAKSRRCKEDAAGECAPPTQRRRQASGTRGGLSCCRGLRKLFRRARRSRTPPVQSSTVAAQEQGCPSPNTQEQTSTSRSSRAVLQISAVHVEKSEHGAAPTMLTVGYKGWWHTPKVHLRLTLERVAEAPPWGPQQQQQQPGAGKGRLQQWFPPGRGPTLQVKGHARTLALRLYTGRRLTAQAEAPVGELLSRTVEGVARVPLQVVKARGAVQVTWVEVMQVSPRPSPLPPPRWPLPFPSQDKLLPPNHLVFPPAQEPTSFRLQQLVRDMYGAPSDDIDWSKPFQFSREASPAGDATTTTTTTTATCSPIPATTSSKVRTARTARTSAITSSTALPEATSWCRRALRFVLQCCWVLIGYKIATDMMLHVYWAFLDTTQDMERGLSWTPSPPH